jgi:DNA-binding transcriptional LysR family regulator
MLRVDLAGVPARRRWDLERRLSEQPHLRLHDPHACLEVAARSICLTGAPEPMVEPYLKARRLMRVPMRLRITTNTAVIWNPRWRLTPVAERLIEALAGA